jgi:hypothetical protein
MRAPARADLQKIFLGQAGALELGARENIEYTPCTEYVTGQIYCYCSLDSGPKGHGLSKLRLSELYARAAICTSRPE